MKKAMKQSVMIRVLNMVSILLLLLTFLSFGVNAVYNGRISRANNDRYDLSVNANLFMDGSKTLTNEVRAYAATGNRSHYDNYMNEVNTVKSRETGVANMREIGITDEEEAMIAEMSSLSNELVPLEEQAMDMASAGRTDEALGYVYGDEYLTSINKIAQIRSRFVETLNSRTERQVKTLDMICTLTSFLAGLSLAALAVIQFIQSYLTKKKLIQPILAIEKEMSEIAEGRLSSDFHLEPDSSEIGMLIWEIILTKNSLKTYIGDIAEKLSQMAKGNMDLKLELDYIGDFKPIKDSFTVIVNSLNNTLARIDETAASVSGHADQVAAGAQGLAQGATEQASTVEELSSTIGELTDRMSNIADHAMKAKTLTNESTGNLQSSNQKMQEMRQAMENISASSQEIGKIIKTIEDIASQTNILALNAAVEAARAGEAGKGFAVVADEVRSLANKSQEASRQTNVLIDNSTQAVARGVGLAEDTARALNSVVEGARLSVEFVDAIAMDSEQQAAALRQVSSGIEQIASVVQTNSATAEQSAAASGELSTQAEQLKRLVGAFRLRSR